MANDQRDGMGTSKSQCRFALHCVWSLVHWAQPRVVRNSVHLLQHQRTAGSRLVCSPTLGTSRFVDDRRAVVLAKGVYNLRLQRFTRWEEAISTTYKVVAFVLPPVLIGISFAVKRDLDANLALNMVPSMLFASGLREQRLFAN